MAVVPLSLPARCLLGEERFGHLKVVERLWRQGVEQSEVTPFRLEGKVRHMIRLLRE